MVYQIAVSGEAGYPSRETWCRLPLAQKRATAGHPRHHDRTVGAVHRTVGVGRNRVFRLVQDFAVSTRDRSRRQLNVQVRCKTILFRINTHIILTRRGHFGFT